MTNGPGSALIPAAPRTSLCGRGHRARARGATAARAAAGAGGPRPDPSRHRVDPAGLWALLRRPGARGARGRGARRDGQPGRGEFHQPRWLDQQGGHLVGGRAQDWFADDAQTLVRWHETPGGGHIELGIAETNLVGLLGELGAAWSRYGQPLFPIGTICDPFVGRALEPWSFGIYAGGQSILVGTPSGVSLAPRAGPTSRSSRRRSASASRAARPGSRPSDRISNGRCWRRSHASAGPAASPHTSGSRRGRSSRRSRAGT